MKHYQQNRTIIIVCLVIAGFIICCNLVNASEPSFEFYFDWTGGVSYKDFNSTNCFEACLEDPRCIAYSSKLSDNSYPFEDHSGAVFICSLLSEIKRAPERVNVWEPVEPMYLAVYQKTSPFTMDQKNNLCYGPVPEGLQR